MRKFLLIKLLDTILTKMLTPGRENKIHANVVTWRSTKANTGHISVNDQGQRKFMKKKTLKGRALVRIAELLNALTKQGIGFFFSFGGSITLINLYMSIKCFPTHAGSVHLISPFEVLSLAGRTEENNILCSQDVILSHGEAQPGYSGLNMKRFQPNNEILRWMQRNILTSSRAKLKDFSLN